AGADCRSQSRMAALHPRNSNNPTRCRARFCCCLSISRFYLQRSPSEHRAASCVSRHQQPAWRTVMAMRSFAAVAAAALLATAAAAQAPKAPSASSSESGAPIATVTEQTKDQWLASQLIGTTVYNSSNERVGSINDLLLDEKGTPLAVVIKSGGFLGMGGKKVTVDLKSVQLMRTADGDKV